MDKETLKASVPGWIYFAAKAIAPLTDREKAHVAAFCAAAIEQFTIREKLAR